MKTDMSAIFRRVLAAACCVALSVSLVGCGSDDDKSSSTSSSDSSQVQDTGKFSDTILFTINHGASVSGTKTECADADITVYTDGSVSIFMVNTDFETVIEIGSFTLTDEDFSTISDIGNPEKLDRLKVTESPDELGAEISYILLYGPDDMVLEKKGGRRAQGKDFSKTYNKIKTVLEDYPLEEIVRNHKLLLEQAENAQPEE